MLNQNKSYSDYSVVMLGSQAYKMILLIPYLKRSYIYCIEIFTMPVVIDLRLMLALLTI